MDTAITVVLGLAILLGVAVLVALGQGTWRRRRENRREQAHVHRQEADVRAARADRHSAAPAAGSPHRTASPARKGVPEVRDRRPQETAAQEVAGPVDDLAIGDDPVGPRRYAGQVVQPDEGVNGFDSGR